jgi:hypothetical protein
LHSPYLLVYRFRLACCGAVCFFALVEILEENFHGDFFYFFGYGQVVFSWYRINVLVLFFLFAKRYIICR